MASRAGVARVRWRRRRRARRTRRWRRRRPVRRSTCARGVVPPQAAAMTQGQRGGQADRFVRARRRPRGACPRAGWCGRSHRAVLLLVGGGVATEPCRKPFGLRLDHRVGQAPGVVQGQVALDDRIGHHRVVDRGAVLVERGAHRQPLHVDGAADVGGEVERQVAHRDGVDAVAVDDARDLDAGMRPRGSGSACRSFMTLPTIRAGHPGRHRLGDRRGIFAAALDLERLAGVEPSASSRRTRRGCPRPGRGTRRSGC